MKLAIFDFDGTLFPKDSLSFLLSKWKALKCSRFAYYRTLFSLIPLFLRYKLSIGTKPAWEEMKLLAVHKFNKIFSGRNEQEIEEYFSVCAQGITGLLNEAVVMELEKARADGFHTVLLSGTYLPLLLNIGEHLGFDTIIGSEINYTDQGLFAVEREPEIVIGNRKLQKIRETFSKEEVDWQGSLAYADGLSDLDLLQAVGNPVVVRPEAQLKDLAIENGWRILA